MSDRDSFLRALLDLDSTLDDNIARAKVMKQRIAQIQQKRAAGRSYKDIVDSEERPLVVQLITESRRALHEEGMTMEQIAAKFGVTRQRVSGLLSDARADPR